MIRHMSLRRLAETCAAVALLTLGTQAAHAQSVIDRWSSITVPPPPPLAPASVDSAKAALLILDMYPTSCNATQRPTCVPTIPRIQRLLADARAHKMAVIYSAGVASANGPSLPVDALTPLPGEPTVRSGADKFMGSDLEKILREKGIETVIVVGTSADGAVLYTGSHASLLGFKVVVPVDGMSSANPFAELYTAWHFKNSTASVTQRVTLTSTELITLK